MYDLAARVELNIIRAKKYAAAAALDAAIDFSPVDTGRFRSNWRVALNASLDNVIPAHYPGENLGRGETANARMARALALPRLRAGLGDLILVYNNTWYGPALNNGKSKQTAAGFVHAAAAIGALEVKKMSVLGISGVALFSRQRGRV